MPLSYRRSFKLFPGLRINVSKSGISTSVGVPGAMINFGPRGVRTTVGLPGTGLSYSTFAAKPKRGRTTPHAISDPAQTDIDSGEGEVPAIAVPTAPPQSEPLSDIASAPVERLTSSSLEGLRELVSSARRQAKNIKAELDDTRRQHQSAATEQERRRRSWFRMFYKQRLAELEASVPQLRQQVNELEAWLESTVVAVEFNANEAADRSYSQLIRRFERLRQSSGSWDITADRNVDKRRERTTADRSVKREKIALQFSRNEIVQFSGQALRFENRNGDDILIYPGLVLILRTDGEFALIEIPQLRMSATLAAFHESEVVPRDANVVGHTWLKTNKDGSRDRRFKDNMQIPVCAYGHLRLEAATGLNEEYMFSAGEALFEFAEAFADYQRLL